MTRRIGLGSLLILTILFLSSLTVRTDRCRAEGKAAIPTAPAAVKVAPTYSGSIMYPLPATAEASPRKLPKTTAEVVQELVLLLEETKSEQTFTLTVGILSELGGEARGAIPAILRNAERLKLLKDKDPDQSRLVSGDLRAAIQAILRKGSESSEETSAAFSQVTTDRVAVQPEKLEVGKKLAREPLPEQTGPSVKNEIPAGWVAFSGHLRKAGRAIEAKATFVVEMQESGHVSPVAFVVASPGIELDFYVGKTVEVWGPAEYRGDLRSNYMTVMRVLEK